MSEPTAPLTTQGTQDRVFHLFGQLPTELRLDIWVASWEPRTVSGFARCCFEDDGHTLDEHPQGLPASAYVNSEARGETLRYYKQCFAQRNGHRGVIWFNSRLDTLCLASIPEIDRLRWVPGRLEFVNPDDLISVRSLVLPPAHRIETVTSGEDIPPEEPGFATFLDKVFPSLEKITFVSDCWRLKPCDKNKPLVRYVRAGIGHRPAVRAPDAMRTVHSSRLRYSPFIFG
ncbi:hypothetical protein GGR50DRAFT_193760 [Xylaria sp. CBS 124048]|nr:hypothetical protein GGR50DRAFT_193760 [Xylaria sp. CBS 124048]